VEFKDELDALGMKVDAMDKSMTNFRRRLSGWRMTGRIRVDGEYRAMNDKTARANELMNNSVGNVAVSDAIINFQRYFGEDEKAFFHMRLRWRSGNGSYGQVGLASDPDNDDIFGNGYFYVSVPFFGDSTLTVGYAGDDDIDGRFGFWPDMNGRYFSGGTGWFNDNQKYLFKLTKGFDLGDIYFSVAHPGDTSALTPGGTGWEVVANANVSWSDVLGFGIGGQYLKQGDWKLGNWTHNLQGYTDDEGNIIDGRVPWENVFTGWVGVDFNFMQGVALHGIGYFQSKSGITGTGWNQGGNAWRVALDVNQDILKFTSFYGEFGSMQKDFWAVCGRGYQMFMFSDRDNYRANGVLGWNLPIDDITFWKIGAAQNWTDQWRTWLFYAQGDLGIDNAGNDSDLNQIMVGIDYAYNPYTVFTLSYMQYNGTWFRGIDDFEYKRVRFSTQVNF